MTVRAGGGIVVRERDGAVELLLVHRPRYDDWTFPKGKQDPGETDLQTAWREVVEETGYEVRPLRELPSTSYVDHRGRDKIVRYWAMAWSGGEFVANDECDAMAWVSADAAADRLTYGRDREMLAGARDLLAPRLQVLATNDDGIQSAGLVALANAFSAIGADVRVVAPADEFSGSSASIGPIVGQMRLDVEQVEVPDLHARSAQAVSGPPGMIVLLANVEAFGPRPDLVVSGINPGFNTGRSTLHSGTVGATLTAVKNGICGLAVSQGVGDPQRYDVAASVAVAVSDQLLAGSPPVALNLNVPNLSGSELGPVRWTSLAPIGAVHTVVRAVGDGYLDLELEDTDIDFEPDTDTATVRRGEIALSSLAGPVALDPEGPPPKFAGS